MHVHINNRWMQPSGLAHAVELAGGPAASSTLVDHSAADVAAKATDSHLKNTDLDMEE